MFRRVKALSSLIKYRRIFLPLIQSYTFFLESKEDSLWGSLSETDRAEMERLVYLVRNHEGPIIEIGTLFGFTTQLIASCKRAGQQLITIDNFSWNPFMLPASEHREFTRSSLRYCLQHANVTLFEGTGEEFLGDYKGPRPALVFIDAGHDYQSVKRDIELAQRSAPTIISGHDYSKHWPGVVQAVDEMLVSVNVCGSVWSSVQPEK